MDTAALAQACRDLAQEALLINPADGHAARLERTLAALEAIVQLADAALSAAPAAKE